MNSSGPPSLTDVPDGYAEWLAELKSRVQGARQRAATAANRELVALYWQIGRDILAQQASQGWGALSRANLLYMRAFAEAWPDEEIVQQAVGHLPWGHNLVLLSKLKTTPLRLAYAQRAIEQGWSRAR